MKTPEMKKFQAIKKKEMFKKNKSISTYQKTY